MSGILAAFVAVSSTLGASFLPPLEDPPRLTSTFGEYRSGHYHGGLDFSTGGTTGWPVRAPESGWVYRVRASGVGYGRVLYLRLQDGHTVVLAHLESFRGDIQRAVELRQRDLGRYEIDWYPDPGTFRFDRGEEIARSGASGAGPPHLHAEIRTGSGADVAIDPLAFGWGVPDSLPPVLDRLRVETLPVHPDSKKKTVSLEAQPSFTTEGAVRIWVSSYDAHPGGRLGIRSLKVWLNETLVQEVHFREFSWESPGEVEWTYHEASARSVNERWICLDAPGGVPSGMYRSGAMPTLPSGVHELRLEAEDQAGNRTERSLRWKVSEPRQSRSEPPPRPGVFFLNPEETQRVSIPGIYIDFPRRAVYESLFIRISSESVPADPGTETELEPLSPVFHVDPWAHPLRKRVEVGMMLPTFDPRAAIYSWGPKGWSYEGATPVLGGIRTGIRNLERLALFRDETPPRVELASKPSGSRTRPRFRARIVETGSGVTWKTLTMFLNGEEVVAEWDPEQGVLTGRGFEALPSGEHLLRVVAADRAGNVTETETRFRVDP